MVRNSRPSQPSLARRRHRPLIHFQLVEIPPSSASFKKNGFTECIPTDPSVAPNWTNMPNTATDASSNASGLVGRCEIRKSPWR
mmetsp:Transcript_25556/g.73898  ORF Transcript_25556/g.73898 Transcript_25556/m.73898 type:complete len:84 (-) Transcript_25556:2201-2452(-)